MHLTADISVSDEFQNVNTFILEWRLVYRCTIKTNEVTKYKRYQNITLYQCMVGSFDKLNIKCRKILSTFFKLRFQSVVNEFQHCSCCKSQ